MLVAAKQTINFVKKKMLAIAISYGEKINFIYPADKTLRIIRIIHFNRAEPTYVTELIFTAPFPANKMELFST